MFNRLLIEGRLPLSAPNFWHPQVGASARKVVASVLPLASTVSERRTPGSKDIPQMQGYGSVLLVDRERCDGHNDDPRLT